MNKSVRFMELNPEEVEEFRSVHPLKMSDMFRYDKRVYRIRNTGSPSILGGSINSPFISIQVFYHEMGVWSGAKAEYELGPDIFKACEVWALNEYAGLSAASFLNQLFGLEDD